MSTETKPLVNGKDSDDEHLRRLKKYQPWAFFVTFGGYFMAHLSRKCYSTVKGKLVDKAHYTPMILSEMDFTFMFSYAIGNIVSGRLGDIFNPTTVLSIGLFGSAACLFLMNVSLWLDFEGQSPILGNIFILFVYCLFGLFQSTGGPVGTVVMGNWYCDAKSVENRGLIFGLWTCHQYCGDIAAHLCTFFVLDVLELPYWWGCLIPAIANFLWGLLTMRLVADPATVGIETPEVRIRMEKLAQKRKELEEEGLSLVDEGPTPITYSQAFAIPMVAQYALAFGFFKFTNYFFFFWLPYILEQSGFTTAQASLISILYSVGMMPGGIIVGFVSDMFGGRRAVVIGTFMSALLVLLYVFATHFDSLSVVALLASLGLMGILIGGPNNIITSAVAADLASHPSVRGSNKSLGTVTGLINGCGSITAAFGLLFVAPIAKTFGWEKVYFFMMGFVAAGTLLLSPKIYSEIRGGSA